jgi:hypothetical protein
MRLNSKGGIDIGYPEDRDEEEKRLQSATEA